jgi:transcriptional regulator with XRE-family HTH domain
MLGADAARLRQLGELLRLRRAALGSRHVPAFIRARDVSLNTRMVGDIEHGRRDTYTHPTLQDIAAAYEVTYDSLVAVAAGEADELTPAEAGQLSVARILPAENAPMDDPAREEADRPYFVPVLEKIVRLLDDGIADPSGEQLGLSPADAKIWDGSHGAMSQSDRAWLVADMQRRRDARAARPNSGAAGA